jgi:MFS family permease
MPLARQISLFIAGGLRPGAAAHVESIAEEGARSSPPDGGQWPPAEPSLSAVSPARVLIPMGLAVCLSPFGDLALYAVLVTQLDVVGLTLGAVGIMLGINRLIRIPSNPLAGVLFDRGRRRPLFLLGMLLGVLSTAGYAFFRGFWPFLVARLAWGIAWTLISVGGMSMVVDVSTRANRGRWMGVFNTWILVGLALGPTVGGLLVDAIGFRNGMVTCAAITAAGLAVALIALPETAPRGPGSRPAATDWRRRLRGLWTGRFEALARANPNLMAAGALYLIVQFTGEGIVLSTISLLLQQRFGDELALGSLAPNGAWGLALGVASAGGLMLGIRSLLAGAVGPLAGHLSDARFGRWTVITASLAGGIAGFGLLATATSLGWIILGVALGAASAGAALAVLGAVVGDSTPPGRQGVVMGAYATAGDIGSAAGPFLAFALLSAVDLKWVYLFCSLAFLIGLGLIWRTRKVRL